MFAMTLSLSVQNLCRNNPLPDSSGRLLDSINFHLKSGDRIALQGKSGSGKSLLMRAVVGLDAMDSGDVILNDRELTSDWICQFRTQVAYVPQRCSLLPGTVRQNLERAKQLQVHKLKHYDFDHAQALADIGYSNDLLDRDVQLLSGGELQLVNLLRAIQFSPPILLLDEPTAAMDVNTAQRVENWLLQWQSADPRRAWLWISHDPNQCSRISTAIWQMADGKLV
jgi:putative ABC transport system ATP-binding protein